MTYPNEKLHRYPGVGQGWQDLIEKVDDVIRPNDGKILMCQEVEGGLRIHYVPAEDGKTFSEDQLKRIKKAVAVAEQKSFVTCECCGSFHATTRDIRGWVKTVCDNHFEILWGLTVPDPSVAVERKKQYRVDAAKANNIRNNALKDYSQ